MANVGAPFNAASNRSTFFQIKLCRSEEYALLSPPSDVLPYRGQPVPAVCDSALNRVCSYVNNPTLSRAIVGMCAHASTLPCPASLRPPSEYLSTLSPRLWHKESTTTASLPAWPSA